MILTQHRFSLQMVEALVSFALDYVANHGVFPDRLTLEFPPEPETIIIDPRPKTRRMTWQVFVPPFKESTIAALTGVGKSQNPQLTWQQVAFPQVSHMIYFECVNDETVVDLQAVK